MKSILTVILILATLGTQAQSSGDYLVKAQKRAQTGTILLASGLTLSLIGIASGQDNLMKPLGVVGGLAMMAGSVTILSAWWQVGKAGELMVTGTPTGIKLKLKF